MSFEIFFYSYKRGEPYSFPLSDAESAFQAAIVRRERTESDLFWRLEYPILNPPDVPPVMQFNGREYPVLVCDCSEVYLTVEVGTDSRPMTDGFMVSGPAGHHDFYAALLHLLQTTHSALFWPGNNSLVVGQFESIEHLPKEMIESLGEPFIINEPQQIIDRICAS
ncbi:hypothetical protein [Janthinobacterium sp. LB3P112]|uniref:hypothetical protein n=1 Tax=Janthinobacterium sp. LB3P112 TaxID=3424196 RepID=UPI003F1E7EDC